MIIGIVAYVNFQSPDLDEKLLIEWVYVAETAIKINKRKTNEQVAYEMRKISILSQLIHKPLAENRCSRWTKATLETYFLVLVLIIY